MTFKVVLEPGEDDGSSECPSLPACVSQGRTEAEAIENIREAIRLWMEKGAEKQIGPLPTNARTLELTV